MNLGQTIKHMRKQKGISQIDFSQQLGVSQISISKIELNKTKPHPPLMDKICKVLETPVGMIMILSVEEQDIPEHKRPVVTALLNAIKEQFIND